MLRAKGQGQKGKEDAEAATQAKHAQTKKEDAAAAPHARQEQEAQESPCRTGQAEPASGERHGCKEMPSPIGKSLSPGVRVTNIANSYARRSLIEHGVAADIWRLQGWCMEPGYKFWGTGRTCSEIAAPYGQFGSM